MRSKSPSQSPSPPRRDRVASKDHAIALQGLARLSVDVFTEKKPFAGLVICVTGLSREARKQVQMLTERMGGQYSPDLHVNCTHLVVQSCSGRKFEHAVKHGLHRGLYVVTLPWFLNSAKQYDRLDESLYLVPKITVDDPIHEYSAEAVANSSMPNMSIPASSNTEAAIRMQSNALYVPKSSGASVITSSSTAQTPRSSHASHKSPSNALAGARFFIDSDLPRDLRVKVQEAAESWGATFVEVFSNNSSVTHVVCEPNTLFKYIGHNLHLVSNFTSFEAPYTDWNAQALAVTISAQPMWVLSARDGFPLRCVQYSADLARNVADFLLTGRNSGQNLKVSMHTHGGRGPGKMGQVPVHNRQEKVLAAKAGVRRRRGVRMQPCRTLPRPLTPTSILDSTCWVITEDPTAAQVYTNSSGKVVLENGQEVENGHGNKHHHDRYEDPLHGVLEKDIYTRPLTDSEKREIVFRGAFLTILFPIDRFSELGPSSRTFFNERGFSREEILQLVYSFYQECLSPEEIEAAIHTDSKHADRLRSIYISKETDELGYVAMGRSEFLGSRRQFEGLKRVSQEPTGHIYDLWLGS